MSRLGVVTCQILELEFAHVLLNDPDVEQVWVIQDEFSQELIRILETTGQKTVLKAAHAGGFESDESDETGCGLIVVIRVMKVGLHSNIPILRSAVVDAVSGMAPFVDAILLGYGLCGNALENTKELFKDISVPVSLPMDNQDVIDDCVGLIIGGRKNYYAEQCSCAGTMFMNAGFSRHWENILSFDIPEKLIPKKEKILKRFMKSYERSLLLPTPVLGEDELRKNTEEFNEKHGLRVETCPGTLALFETAWEEAKNNTS